MTVEAAWWKGQSWIPGGIGARVLKKKLAAQADLIRNPPVLPDGTRPPPGLAWLADLLSGKPACLPGLVFQEITITPSRLRVVLHSVSGVATRYAN